MSRIYIHMIGQCINACHLYVHIGRFFASRIALSIDLTIAIALLMLQSISKKLSTSCMSAAAVCVFLLLFCVPDNYILRDLHHRHNTMYAAIRLRSIVIYSIDNKDNPMTSRKVKWWMTDLFDHFDLSISLKI